MYFYHIIVPIIIPKMSFLTGGQLFYALYLDFFKLYHQISMEFYQLNLVTINESKMNNITTGNHLILHFLRSLLLPIVLLYYFNSVRARIGPNADSIFREKYYLCLKFK